MLRVRRKACTSKWWANNLIRNICLELYPQAILGTCTEWSCCNVLEPNAKGARVLSLQGYSASSLLTSGMATRGQHAWQHKPLRAC